MIIKYENKNIVRYKKYEKNFINQNTHNHKL